MTYNVFDGTLSLTQSISCTVPYNGKGLLSFCTTPHANFHKLAPQIMLGLGMGVELRRGLDESYQPAAAVPCKSAFKCFVVWKWRRPKENQCIGEILILALNIWTVIQRTINCPEAPCGAGASPLFPLSIYFIFCSFFFSLSLALPFFFFCPSLSFLPE